MLINPSTDARGAEEVTEGNWSREKMHANRNAYL
jgi:hypothetical protein